MGSQQRRRGVPARHTRKLRGALILRDCLCQAVTRIRRSILQMRQLTPIAPLSKGFPVASKTRRHVLTLIAALVFGASTLGAPARAAEAPAAGGDVVRTFAHRAGTPGPQVARGRVVLGVRGGT